MTSQLGVPSLCAAGNLSNVVTEYEFENKVVLSLAVD